MDVERVLVLDRHDLGRKVKMTPYAVNRISLMDFPRLSYIEVSLADRVEFRFKKLVKVLKHRWELSE